MSIVHPCPPIQRTDAGLNRYLEEIRRFPMLSQEEEIRLGRQVRKTGDPAALRILTTSHLRLVGKVAMGYRGYGLPIADIIEEGNIGLIQAVHRFDPARECRLATYALWWIKAAIHEYILRSWSMVKLGTTTNQKKLFFGLRRAKSRIGALEDGDLHPDHVAAIAALLDVQATEVVEMNRRLAGDCTLNAPIGSETGSSEWLGWLVDEDEGAEAQLLAKERQSNGLAALYKAMDHLGPRERRIFEARRLADTPATLGVLAEEHGVSPERIRQIEVRAFEKLQAAVRQEMRLKYSTVSHIGGRLGRTRGKPFNKPRTPASLPPAAAA